MMFSGLKKLKILENKDMISPPELSLTVTEELTLMPPSTMGLPSRLTSVAVITEFPAARALTVQEVPVEEERMTLLFEQVHTT